VIEPGTRPPLAKKRFGQNFLHDQNIIARIIHAISPKPGQALIEIGPGRGALTKPLLAAGEKLQVIELDRDVIPFLQAHCEHHPGLVIHQRDALKVDFPSLAPGQPLRVVGNLPYNISTPLLFHLLQFADHIRDMHFMLQKEVVDRMVAKPGGGDYGRLTVSLAARAECVSLFRVSPGAFHPAPKVYSAVVRVRPRPAPFAIPDFGVYDRIVTAAFGQRRKTLSNALKGLLDSDQIRAANVDPSLRAERLSAAEFGALSCQLVADAGSAQKPEPGAQ